MRPDVPPAFDLSFTGPEGPYTLHFQPTDGPDGLIRVSIAGVDMEWDSVDAKHEPGGGIVLSGMAYGTEQLWNDTYWFELRLGDSPPVIRYWADKVVWREDHTT